MVVGLLANINPPQNKSEQSGKPDGVRSEDRNSLDSLQTKAVKERAKREGAVEHFREKYPMEICQSSKHR